MTNADQSPIDMTVYHVRVFTLRTTGEHVGEYVHLADHGSTLTLDAWLETEANAGFSLGQHGGGLPLNQHGLAVRLRRFVESHYPGQQGPERQGPERQGPERQGPERQGTVLHGSDEERPGAGSRCAGGRGGT